MSGDSGDEKSHLSLAGIKTHFLDHSVCSLVIIPKKFKTILKNIIKTTNC